MILLINTARDRRSVLLLLTTVLTFWWSATADAGQTVFVSDIGATETYDDSNGDYLGPFGETVDQNLLGLAFHPVTGNLIAGNRDGLIQEYDGETGDLIGTFGDAADHVTSPYDLVFHPVTGSLLVLDEGSTIPFVAPVVQEYDGTTGNYIGDFGATGANLTGEAQQHMAFSLITGNLLIADLSDVREFDGTTGAYLGIFGTTAANTGIVKDLAINPADGNLFVADFTNNDIREFDGTTGNFVRSLNGGGAIQAPRSLSFVPAVIAPSGNPGELARSTQSSPDAPAAPLHILNEGTGFSLVITVMDSEGGVEIFEYGGGQIGSSGGTSMTIISPISTTNAVSSGNFREGARTGDPVSTFTGELIEGPVTDIALGGLLPLTFSRYYASNLKTDNNIRSSLGNNWLHNYDMRLRNTGTSVTVTTNQGRVIHFQKNAASWDLTGKMDVPYQLSESGTDFVFLDPTVELMYTFDTKGKPTLIDDGHGYTRTLIQSTWGMLDRVEDNLGRSIRLNYLYGEYLSGGGPLKLSSVVSIGESPTRTMSYTLTGDDLTSTKNAQNQITTFAYDPGGLLTAKTRHLGNTPFAQTWNGSGQVATQTDSFGNTYTLSYNGLVTNIADPLGNSQEHTHTATGEFSNREDEAGLSFSLGSDSTGRRNALTDRLGATTSVNYHTASGNVSSVVNADGTTQSYSYTPRVTNGVTHYDLTGITHADATIQSFVYDANGNLITHTDQLGNVSSATFNANGLPLSTTNAAGGVTLNTYNADSTLATSIDPAGNTTSHTYDGRRRPIQTTFADGAVASVIYDRSDHVISATDGNGNTDIPAFNNNGLHTITTDALGNRTRFYYDTNDRLYIVQYNLNNTVRRTFDTNGRVATVKNGNSNTTSFTYNERGRLTSTTDPGGNVWATTYDAEAIIKSSTDPLLNTTNFTSDVMGRITQVSSPLGNTTTVSYNARGSVSSVTDALNNTTTLTRDARGSVSDISLAGGAISVNYNRNALGQITDITDPNGKIWNRAYDNLGRPVSSTDPLGNVESNTFDNRNRLSVTTFPGALGTQTLNYDPAGNLISRSYSDGTTFSFSYDVNNHLISATGVTLTYDSNDRIIESNGITVTRDSGDRITQMTLAPAKTVTYAYDSNDRVTQVTDWLGGTSTFTYDAAGRLTSMTRPNGITTTKSYDNDSRLLTLTEGTLSSIVLSRDANGQVTNAARNTPLTSSAQNVVQVSNTVDAASQLNGATYDAMGRMTNQAGQTYSWNLASQLTSFDAGSGTVSSTYDAAGNRISRTQGGVTHNYTWNLMLGLPSISVVEQSGNDIRYHVHTPGGTLLYVVDASDDARSFYHFDEMGNTLFVSNDVGSTVASYAYTPFGQLIEKTGSVDNPFTWQGRYGIMDEGDGLYYIRARYYDANTGRFISRDSAKSINPKKVNPYQYALNNPLVFVDVNGRDPQPNGIQDSDIRYAASGELMEARMELSVINQQLSREIGHHSLHPDGKIDEDEGDFISYLRGSARAARRRVERAEYALALIPKPRFLRDSGAAFRYRPAREAPPQSDREAAKKF